MAAISWLYITKMENICGRDISFGYTPMFIKHMEPLEWWLVWFDHYITIGSPGAPNNVMHNAKTSSQWIGTYIIQQVGKQLWKPITFIYGPKCEKNVWFWLGILGALRGSLQWSRAQTWSCFPAIALDRSMPMCMWNILGRAIPWQRTTSHPTRALRYRGVKMYKVFPRNLYSTECHTMARLLKLVATSYKSDKVLKDVATTLIAVATSLKCHGHEFKSCCHELYTSRKYKGASNERGHNALSYNI